MGLVGLTALALVCAACDSATTTSAGSCVGPYLNDQPPEGAFQGPARTVAPGGTITIYGHWYTTTCNDTGGHDPVEPMPPVHLTLTLPGGAVKKLGEFQPRGGDVGFSTTVQVPAGTPAGAAVVRDDRPNPGTYTFQVGR